MQKKRIEELDIIKGLGIIIIAVIHLVYRTKEGIADNMLMPVGWNLIALYFMLSGFSFTAGKRTVRENYLNRLKHLLLPAVITEIVLLAVGGVYCVFAHGYNVTDWLHDITVTVLRPEWCRNISAEWGNGGVLFENLSPSWFIWTMAWTELLFFPLAHITIGKPAYRWWITIAALTAAQILLYIFVSPVSWQLQIVPLFTIFMLIGAKTREMKLAEKEWKLNVPLTVLVFAAAYAALIGLFMLGGNMNYYAGIIGIHKNALDVLLTIVQLIPGCIAFYALSKLILKLRWLSDGLIWVGKHTFMFLMCHCFFGMIAADIMQTYIKPGPMWYVENAGLTLTPEIFWKSAAGCATALICCSLVCLVQDKVKAHFAARK